MYTAKDARRECKELFDEGYGFDSVRIFLHDLARSNDISWDDSGQILREILNGEFGEINSGWGTYA